MYRKATQLKKPRMNVHPTHGEWSISHLSPLPVTGIRYRPSSMPLARLPSACLSSSKAHEAKK